MRRNKLLLILLSAAYFVQINVAQDAPDAKFHRPIINGRAVALPPPVYPPEAEDFCAGGAVEVEVKIVFENSLGKVISANAVSGDERLRKSSEEAAMKAKFRKQDDVDERRLAGFIVYNFEPKVKCITTGIVNKKSIYLPQPDVSDMIQYEHLQLKSKQIVAVQIIVNTEGEVVRAKAIAGNPLLRAVCENAARQSRFDPVNDVGSQFKVKALLAYKFKPDGMVETDIEIDDRDVIGTPIDLIKPPPPFCNCRFDGNSNVFVKAKIDGKGDVTGAEALNGHPILKNISKKAALESKFLPTNFRAEVLIVYEFDAINNYREVRLSDIYVKEVKVENPIIIGHAPPNTQPIYSPQPEFPAAAKLVGVSGEVKVEILIDVNGNVEEAYAVSGNPLLRSAAVKAARQTKFKPMTLSGTPVKVRSLIVYDFKP